MSLMSSLPDKLCEWFSDMNEFSDCSFCTQFPAGFKATPLTNPIIVFGTKSIEVPELSYEEDIAVNPDVRKVTEQFSVGIHVPRHAGGTYCNAVFERIADQLLFNTSIAIAGITAGEVEYIRNTDSLFMNMIFTVSGTMKKGEYYSAAFEL